MAFGYEIQASLPQRATALSLGVERSGTPGTVTAGSQPAQSGRQPSDHCKHCRPLRGLAFSLDYQPGVPLRSTPRLYATSRYRGLGLRIHAGSFLAAESRLFVQRLKGGLNSAALGMRID
jgi:hypothetical protein